MKKLGKVIVLVLLTWVITLEMGHAEGYLTIRELRETTPAVWQGAYEAEKVGTVTVDVPIILPEVDAFPILRVTVPEGWAFSDGLEILESNPNYFFLGSHFSDYLNRDKAMEWREGGNGLHPVWKTGEDALEAMQRLLGGVSPDFHGITLEPTGSCFYQYEGQQDGEWVGNFYQTFHGIPYLRTLDYLYPPSTQFREKWPYCSAGLGTVLYKEDTYALHGGFYQEIAVEAEDAPLLSWDAIRAAMEEKIGQGYVKEITEVRLGYTAIIDVSKPREYLLIPCWFVRGDLRSALYIQFYRPEELEGIVPQTAYQHFSNGPAFLFPAQTGEFVDRIGDNRPDEERYTVPVLRWEDVQ